MLHVSATSSLLYVLPEDALLAMVTGAVVVVVDIH